ncbi:MAG: hypothetical protein HY906_03880 [Deltaproteobacteria bacterium]|nr:hypothetical protein [Deltaproteobacteria bacterium]
MRVWVSGRQVRLDPAHALGKGGEADIFDLGNGRALKLFKGADHPDYAGSPDEQRGALMRLALHQTKLREFPRLPAAVVAPEELVTGRGGSPILGYTMRLVAAAEPFARYAEPAFRRQGVAAAAVAELLLSLHRIVEEVHGAGVVIGDFNDQNVLVTGAGGGPAASGCVHLIDSDSFQFGPYPCQVFTERFVDPLLCDPALPHLLLCRPYTGDSDWYAYAALLMQSLLCVGPYGGVYRPQDPSRLVPHGARPLRRITVFHPEVRYPKPALPREILPDDLLHELSARFEQDRRGVFPRSLVEALRFTRCDACGLEHARPLCPACRPVPEGAVKETIVVRGAVTATRIFRTRGVILAAASAADGLAWLYHEDGAFRRESGAVVMQGALDPQLHVRLAGRTTLLGKGGEVVTLRDGAVASRRSVDCCDGAPALDCDGTRAVWADAGQLWRDGRLGRDLVGTVLQGQTRVFCGARFGFGLTRAGKLTLAFVFDAARPGINDRVKLPPMPGRLVRAACAFGGDLAWLFLSLEAGGKVLNRCVVIDATGATVAAAEAEAGDGSWLGAVGGHAAAGRMLLCPTDAGVVRVEPQGRVGTRRLCRRGPVAGGAEPCEGSAVATLQVTREFPDTEPFVHAGCRLVAGADGLYVIDAQEIHLLKLQ